MKRSMIAPVAMLTALAVLAFAVAEMWGTGVFG